MKFALSGTHRSGKTTTLTDVERTFRWLEAPLEIREEVALECPHTPLGERGTFQAQTWIMLQQVLLENTTKTHPLLLVERTVFDHLAYARALYARGRVSNGQKLRFLEAIAERWSDLYPYETIFLFQPLDVTLEDDALRSGSKGWQTDVAVHLQAALEDYVTPGHLEEIQGDRLERAGRIVQHIECIASHHPPQKKEAYFFDVDGTLDGFGGPITPQMVSWVSHAATGIVSLRPFEAQNDQLQTVFHLPPPPIPWDGNKAACLRFIRHVLSNIPPTGFYYIGDKDTDRTAAETTGWRFLSPADFIDHAKR